jgi:hypothetical protein
MAKSKASNRKRRDKASTLIKAALAVNASSAFSDVFNRTFLYAAQVSPNGNVGDFKRWYLHALRAQLAHLEANR